MTGGRRAVQELLQTVVERSPGHETQVALAGGRSQVLRFVENQPVENIEERWLQLRLSLAYRLRGYWRTARGYTSDLSVGGTDRLGLRTEQAALANPRDRRYIELPWADEFESESPDTSLAYDQQTALAGPALVANQVARVLLPSRRIGHAISGALRLSVGTMGDEGPGPLSSLANSKMLFQYFHPTSAKLSLSLELDRGWGRVEQEAIGLNSIDPEGLLEQVIRQAEAPLADRPPAFGPWTALLSSGAIATILIEIAPWFTYGAIAAGVSPIDLGDDLGQALSLRAAPLDGRLMGRPFDAEGWPSRPLELVRSGVVVSLSYTRDEALRHEVPVSGYAAEDPTAVGAIPRSLVMDGDGPTEAELLVSLDGLYIGRLERVRFIGTRLQAVARDTFVVRDGTLLNRVDGLDVEFDVRELFSSTSIVGASVRQVGVAAAAVLAERIDVI